jgi:hypothetical protein
MSLTSEASCPATCAAASSPRSSVAPVEPEEGPLQQRVDAIAQAGPELDQLGLVQSGGPQTSLDIGLVEVGLGLGDAPQGRLVAHPGAPEQLRDLEDDRVILAGPVGGPRGCEPERL